MPSEQDARLRHSEYYYRMLDMATESESGGQIEILETLAILDANLAQIRKGQKWLRSNIETSKKALILCILLPIRGGNFLPLRVSFSERLAWLQDSINGLDGAKKQERTERTSAKQSKSISTFLTSILNYVMGHFDAKRRGRFRWLLEDINLLIWFKNLTHFPPEFSNELNDKWVASYFTIMRATVFGEIGEIHRKLGQVENAIAFQKQVQVILRNRADDPLAYSLILHQANIYSDTGQYLKAREYFEKALQISQQAGNKQREINALINIGLVYKHLEMFDLAIKAEEKAVLLAREVKNTIDEGVALGNLGEIYRFMGRYEMAFQPLTEALAIADKVGDKYGKGIRLGNLGSVYGITGQYDKALTCYQESLAIAYEINDRRGEANRLGNMGKVYINIGEFEKALECLSRAVAIHREVGNKRSEANDLADLGYLFGQKGETKHSIECYSQARAIYLSIGLSNEVKRLDSALNLLRKMYL